MVRAREGDKEEAILHAASSLFLEKGVKSTTIQQIAKRAGVAVGTIYLYSRDKKEIVRSVAYAFAQEHQHFSEEILHSRISPLEKLKRYISGLYDLWRPYGENTPGAVELAQSILEHAPETPDMARQLLFSTLEKILKEAKEQGKGVSNPSKEARWIVLSTSTFFPLAGTPAVYPLKPPPTREDLIELLKWLGRDLK